MLHLDALNPELCNKPGFDQLSPWRKTPFEQGPLSFAIIACSQTGQLRLCRWFKMIGTWNCVVALPSSGRMKMWTNVLRPKVSLIMALCRKMETVMLVDLLVWETWYGTYLLYFSVSLALMYFIIIIIVIIIIIIIIININIIIAIINFCTPIRLTLFPWNKKLSWSILRVRNRKTNYHRLSWTIWTCPESVIVEDSFVTNGRN